MIDAQLLQTAVGCTPERADLFAPHLSAACRYCGIDTPERLAALDDMSPREAHFDAPDLGLRDSDLARNVTLHQPLTKQGADSPHFLVIEFRRCDIDASGESLRLGDRPVARAPRPRRKDRINDMQRMPHVLLMRYVLQILQSVVGLNSILVVDGHSLGARPDECSTNEAVDKERSSGAVPRKADVQISVMVQGRFQQSLRRVIAVGSAHLTKAGNLIGSLVPDHVAPLAIRRFLHPFSLPESTLIGGRN